PGRLDLRVASLAPCADNENADRAFPSGADRAVIELTGGAIAPGAPFVAGAARSGPPAAGGVGLEGLPEGRGLTMPGAAGHAPATLLAGVTRDVAVVEGDESFPPIFLTPVGAVACTGSAAVSAAAAAPTVPRGFAATAAND